MTELVELCTCGCTTIKPGGDTKKQWRCDACGKEWDGYMKLSGVDLSGVLTLNLPAINQ